MPEVEKPELEKTEPRASAARKPPFEFVARGWFFLAALSWAASVYVLPPRGSWFWKPFTHAGGLPIRPSLVAGIAVGVAVLVLLRKLFVGRIGWEKAGQGTAVRVTAYVVTILLALFAGYSFHLIPSGESQWWRLIQRFELLGREFNLRPMFFPSAALVLTVGVVAHYLFGRPKWTDFLIETQGELVKVSWPARKEWVGSSVVVIVVVATVACFLYFADELLTRIMKEINLGF